jgi:fatty acid desaturase
MEYFCKCGVLTFSAWASILTCVQEVVVHAVVHGATAKKKANNQVKVRLKEVYYS